MSVPDLVAAYGTVNEFVGDETSIMWSVGYDNYDVTEFILERFPDAVSYKDTEGYTALHLANEVDIAKLLIDNGANVDAKNKLGLTPLHVAAMRGNFQMVELLLEKADTTIVTVNGSTVLHYAASKDSIDICEEILDYNPNLLDQPDLYGLTPLQIAVMRENLNLIEHLVYNEEADVDVIDEYGSTLLHLAAKSSGYITTLDEDLKKTYEEKSPLFELLWDLELNVDATNDNLDNVVHIASYYNNVGVLNFLMSKGIDLKESFDKANENGRTPLHIAIMKSSGVVASFLAEQGFDMDIKDNYGITPSELAIDKGYKLT